ncbi:DUF2493 domain-containing protein [Microbacterium ginsengisoli]
MRTRLLVAGSRAWTDEAAIFWRLDGALAQLGEVTLVHGACPQGADSIADRWGTARGVPTERHPADWGTHTERCPEWHRGLARCRAAGFRRNAQMVELGADLCLVFVIAQSAGSMMTARLAARAGIETWLFDEAGEAERLNATS